jgi:hypothetical protein
VKQRLAIGDCQNLLDKKRDRQSLAISRKVAAVEFIQQSELLADVEKVSSSQKFPFQAVRCRRDIFGVKEPIDVSLQLPPIGGCTHCCSPFSPDRAAMYVLDGTLALIFIVYSN